MTTKRCADFIDEIKVSPKFSAAARNDVCLIAHLNAIEYGIERLSALTDIDSIECMDAIEAAIASDQPMKVRLLEVGRIMTAYRDRGRFVN